MSTCKADDPKDALISKLSKQVLRLRIELSAKGKKENSVDGTTEKKLKERVAEGLEAVRVKNAIIGKLSGKCIQYRA